MPKIKLKPNLDNIEIGIGNLVNFKISAGETVEVSEVVLSELLSQGYFEIAEEETPGKEKEKEKEEEGNE